MKLPQHLIYLAAPYTGTTDEVLTRVDKVTKFACKLFEQGLLVISPITHCHYIYMSSDHLLKCNFKSWKAFDELILSKCNELWVLALPGWDHSKGVRAEMRLAVKLSLPIKVISPSTYGL